jgi:hypothetical protein
MDGIETRQEQRQDYSVADITDVSVIQVNVSDLVLLREAISRWRMFLMGLFPPPSTREMDSDQLDHLSMEDTERYLDARIQASRCLGGAHDTIPEREFEALFNEIRKGTYHYITGVLPDLCENSRSLMVSAQYHDILESVDGTGDSGWVSLHELDDSLEYKDCLISQRKQLKSEMIRQRSRVTHQFSRLDQLVRRCFRPAD